jgi:hypothetical protein
MKRKLPMTVAEAGRLGGAKNSPAQQAARRNLARLCRSCGSPRRQHVGGRGRIDGRCARYQP